MLVVRPEPLTTLDRPCKGFALTWAPDDSLAARRRAVPPRFQGAALAQRPAVRGRRPHPRTDHRGVPPRYFSVVLRGRADPLVVAGPAHGALPGGVQGLALAAQDAREGPLRDAHRHRLPPGHAG